jgi:hypothetical protein
MNHLALINAENIYCCVLVKGTNAAGERCFAYFGTFVRDLREIKRRIDLGKPFNPANHSCIVLARGRGEPDEHLQNFMRHKFSFSNDEVILELSGRDPKRRTSPT